MFFDNYKKHQDARLRSSLLWEYDLDRFDWDAMQTVVLQRVIERGRITDFYAVLNLYGLKAFKEGVKNIPSLNEKDIAFVCILFGIKKQELKCYTQKQLRHRDVGVPTPTKKNQRVKPWKSLSILPQAPKGDVKNCEVIRR